MSSFWPSTLKSLDDSLAPFPEILAKLSAAQAVELEGIIEQFKVATESARTVREQLLSEMPDASWQSRKQLNVLIAEAQKRADEKALQEARARMLSLATELERGTIVHRRSHRLGELNQLRDHAVEELRSLAAAEQIAQDLPGPRADHWIEWACALKEPQDAESLQVLRTGFGHLDNLVANLEANMWLASAPSAEEAAEVAAIPVGATPEEQPPIAAGEVTEAKSPEVFDEHSLRTLVATTAPHATVPAPTEEDRQRTLARERALLASMMSGDNGSLPKANLESPVIANAYRQTLSPSPEAPESGEAAKPKKRKWWLAGTIAMVALATLAAIQLTYRARSTGAIESVQAKAPEQAQITPQTSSATLPTPVNDSAVLPPNTSLSSQGQPDPQHQAVVATRQAKTQPARRGVDLQPVTLQPPAQSPRTVAMVRKEEDDSPSDSGGVLGAVPGGVPNEIPSSAASIVSKIPVAMPNIADAVKVSSGVAQGMLIHQVTPQYPPLALQARVQGTVVFQVVIGKDGKIEKLHAVSGHPMLVKAAADAVKKWRYKPFYLNGEPVEANTQINVHFTATSK